MRDAAPLFTDAFALAGWMVERLGARPDVLSRRAVGAALDLLEDLTLALKGLDRDARLEAADARLVVLRTHLRLLEVTGGLDEAQLLYALQAADGVGRQIGGWRRQLDRTP